VEPIAPLFGRATAMSTEDVRHDTTGDDRRTVMYCGNAYEDDLERAEDEREPHVLRQMREEESAS